MANLTQNHTTRSTGTVLTANLYNNDHDTHIQNVQGIQVADGYTTSNVTTDRTIDADSTTTAEVADVLCTLIEDLKGIGILQ